MVVVVVVVCSVCDTFDAALVKLFYLIPEIFREIAPHKMNDIMKKVQNDNIIYQTNTPAYYKYCCQHS